jgi:ribosomal protein L37AE/L43A
MAERSKVRLVRCPKCENLLQELPDFSVYQCGGCGTVLRGTLAFPLTSKVFFFWVL